MSRVSVCLDCGQPTFERTRCPSCGVQKRGAFAAGFRRPTKRVAAYDTTAWRRMSARLRAAHVERHGWWCPGWKRDAHPSRDLTVDHVVPLIDGGAALDPANLRVLCRSCNGRAGLSLVSRRHQQRKAAPR
jgi:5-methylcytosine-specific restriction endonuclease McrA